MNWKTIISSILICTATCSIISAKASVKNIPGRPDRQVAAIRNSGAFLYALETSVEPYANLTDTISVNEGEIWDEPTYFIPLAFPFTLNGHDISYLDFYGSGALLRAPTGTSFADTYVFPFETDLIDRGANDTTSLSPISYKVDGPAGNRIQKIEFNNAGSYWEMHLEGTLEMYVNFQLWLYEGSNIVEFRFGPSSVDDPTLFYGGLNGAKLGIIDYDEFTFETTNPHYLLNNPVSPTLSQDIGFLNGTPANGTVYTLYPDLPLEILVAGENNTSVCSPNGSATVTALGGFPPYAYAWSNGETADSLFHLNSGTYDITVTDDNGATISGSVNITSPDTLIAVAGSTDITSVGAHDGTAWIDVGGGLAPYTYLWSTGEVTALIENLAPGMYTVISTDAAGCTIANSVTVADFVCPELTILSVAEQASCSGTCNGRIEITGVGNGVAPFQFAWSNGDSTALLTDLCAGEFSITITDSTGCNITDSIQVTEPFPIHVNAHSTNETVIGDDGMAWASPTGGTPPYTYLWSNGSTDSLIANLIPALYTVIVSDTAGCVDTQTVEVLEFICFQMAVVQAQAISCHGNCNGDLAVTTSGGVGPFRFEWSTGDTTTMTVDLCAGLYSVTITDETQGCSVTVDYDLVQPDSFYIVLDTILHLTDSTETAIHVTAVGGVAPYTYGWLGPNEFLSFEEDLLNIEPGYYFGWARDSTGCVAFLDTLEVRDETVSAGYVPLDNMQITPNPANETLVLDAPFLTLFETKLISVSGEEIASWKNKAVMDISRIPSGYYLLQVISGRNTAIKSVVIQH